MKENGYVDCIFKIYQDSRVFSADEYIGLLQTYSNHMALPPDVRATFFEKIYSAIKKNKTIEIIDTIDLIEIRDQYYELTEKIKQIKNELNQLELSRDESLDNMISRLKKEKAELEEKIDRTEKGIS